MNEEATLQVEIEQLRERVRRLTWALRAIDTRLHAEMNQSLADYQEACLVTGQDPDATLKYHRVTVHTLRQMCNVIVSAIAERPEELA